MRWLVSIVLFYIGDQIWQVCRTRDRGDWWEWKLFRLYSKIMIKSSDLDINNQVWNIPEDGLITPKHLQDDDWVDTVD